MNRFFITSFLLAATPALGNVFTLDTLNRGWITAGGADNGNSVGNSYYAGIDFSSNAGLELRNWFQFDLSPVSGTVSSASLVIDTGHFNAPGSVTSENYQLTSLGSSFGFADLGTAALYGSRVYTRTDALAIRTIALNASAISSIQSFGVFGLGGRLTTLLQSTADEAIFSGISGSPSNVQLVVTTSDQAGTPEPASVLFVLSGLAVITRLRRVRQARY